MLLKPGICGDTTINARNAKT